jgi:DNA-binding PadR family transcriptional regulator
VARSAKRKPLDAGAFHILLALADGWLHGYAIMKSVEGSSGGTVKLGSTTLYRRLRQLHADGWIEELEGDDPADPRRRSYRLTARGRALAREEASRLLGTIRLAREHHLLPSGPRP